MAPDVDWAVVGFRVRCWFKDDFGCSREFDRARGLPCDEEVAGSGICGGLSPICVLVKDG